MKTLVKRSVSLSGHRTSIALEPEFWVVIEAMAMTRALSVAGLIATIDDARTPQRPLASALRVAALDHARMQGQTPRQCDDAPADGPDDPGRS